MAIYQCRERKTYACVQWLGTNIQEIMELAGLAYTDKPAGLRLDAKKKVSYDLHKHDVMVRLQNGALIYINVNDWILKDGDGDFIPIARTVFERDYEVVE